MVLGPLTLWYYGEGEASSLSQGPPSPRSSRDKGRVWYDGMVPWYLLVP